MVFSSHVFLFYFLPLFLVAYYALPGRARHLLLTLASYLFYGWANPSFMLLMLVSTVVDYLCGLYLDRHGYGLGPDNQPRAGEEFCWLWRSRCGHEPVHCAARSFVFQQ